MANVWQTGRPRTGTRVTGDKPAESLPEGTFRLRFTNRGAGTRPGGIVYVRGRGRGPRAGEWSENRNSLRTLAKRRACRHPLSPARRKRAFRLGLPGPARCSLRPSQPSASKGRIHGDAVRTPALQGRLCGQSASQRTTRFPPLSTAKRPWPLRPADLSPVALVGLWFE